MFLARNKKREKDLLLQDLTAKDLEQISIDMENILESNYQKRLQSNTQKALIGSYVDSMRKALRGGDLFDKKIQKAFDVVFADDAILDVALFQSTLEKFLAKHLPVMSSDQKKAIECVGSVRITDILRTLRAQKLISDEEMNDINEKGLIVANSEVKDVINDIFSHVIIPGELSEMAKDVNDQDMVATDKLFSRVPGLNALLLGYDFSPANLGVADENYQKVMDNPSSSSHEKIQAATKAMAKFVYEKDKKLG